MATLTGNLADVTNKAPENISSITVKAPAARIGGSSGSSVIVSSPATVNFNSSTGDITISNLTGGLSWLYIEGDGWADSIGLAVADGMVTLVEAVANALGMPGIVDYLRLLADLENRIDDVAQGAVDAAAENIKWIKRDLATGEDLNTVVAAGLYTIPSYTRATSLINRPPLEAIQSATLRVTVSGGGAVKQRWERLGIAGDRLVTYERSRDSTNTWSAWGFVPDAETVKAADWFKGVIPDGANLDTYQTPGEFEIPSYNVARSLSGRPDGLTQRAMLKVRVAGGTAMHELTEWTSAGVRVWKRETAGGVWRAWREGEEEDIPNTPLQPVYMWGDSAVAGGDTNGSWAAGENLPGRIGALLDTQVESRGVSGHTANTTLIRAGVLEVWATGTIPADTSEASINVAGLDIDLRVRRTFAASWDGIAGTLAIDGDNFTFKRAAAGTAQTISTPKRVILDTAVPLGEGAHIFLMGGNDWLSDAGTAPEANKELHLVESYRRAVEAVPGDPLKKVLIGGLKTRRSTTAGDENDRLVRAVNQRLRTLYPGIFVDRQAWLVSRGLAAAGITPTPADTTAMAAGLVPPSAFATGDDTHIRKEVVQAEAAELWANALVRKGWARLKSGATLPAQVDTYQLGASITDRTGVGSPEGKVAAPVGSIYTDTEATNGSIRWVKASGTGNTGWRDDYGDVNQALETKADKTAVNDAIVGIGNPAQSANELRDPTKSYYWSSDANATGKNLPVNRAGVLTNHRANYNDSLTAQTYLPFRDPNLYVRYFSQNVPHVDGNSDEDGWLRFPSSRAVESLIADAIANIDTGGGEGDTPARSSLTSITCFGDSLTDGYSNNVRWGDEESYPAALGRELGAGVTVTERGMSGATSATINLRAGATPVTFRVPAGTIPGARWSVIPLETTQEHDEWASGTVTRYGYIGGGYGTLSLADGAWTFTRGEPVDDMTADVVEFLGEFKDAASDTIIYGAGRNDITKNQSNIYPSPVESVKASVIEMLAFSNAQTKQVAFLGTITRTDEAPESAGYKQVYEINDWIRERYPDRHIDLQGYLTGSQVWTDTGITPTQADLDAQAQGMTPPSLFDDVTHYSKATAEVIGSKLVAGWLRAKGWVV